MLTAFRVDASTLIGTGHVRRCIALAEALRQRGHGVFFLSRLLPGHISAELTADGFEVRLLRHPSPHAMQDWNAHASWMGVHWTQDARESIQAIGNEVLDWLILDHYAIDHNWERLVRVSNRKLLVIDDLADRGHDCDLLLDANPSPHHQDRYKVLVPDRSRLMLGPRFALLRKEFTQVQPRSHDGMVRHILIFMGGADLTGSSRKVVEALKLLGRTDIEVTVVMDEFSLGHTEVRKLCFDLGYELRTRVDMAKTLSRTDLAIGAAGVNALERCALGVPSILLVLASNQDSIAAELAKRGAAINLGWHESVSSERIVRTLSEVIAQPKLLMRMSRSAQDLVGRHGSEEVVTVMEEDCSYCGR